MRFWVTFSSIFQHIWLYIAHIAHLYYIWAEFAFVGQMHQLYKIFFSLYSDLYYKTRSFGNLLISVNYYPNFIIISNIIHVPFNYL